MKKLRYPDYWTFQEQVELLLKAAVKGAQLVGYRINGSSTYADISVYNLDELMRNLPCVQAELTDILPGHDEENSHQPNYESYTYTELGGNKTVRSTNYIRERLVFTISAYTQKYQEALKIAQALKAFIGACNNYSIEWQDETIQLDTKLDNYVLEVAEATRSGTVDFFRISYSLTIRSAIDLVASDVVSKTIQSVITEVTTEINDEESSETKTIGN